MATGEATESDPEDVNYQIVSGYRVARWAFYWAVLAGVISLLTLKIGVFVSAIALAAPYLILRNRREKATGDESSPEADGDGQTDGNPEYSFW